MLSLLPVRCLLIGLGLLFFLSAAGCATSGDLRKLTAELTQRQDANAAALRTDLKAAQAAQAQQYEELRTTLEGFRAEMATANIVTDYMVKTMDGINTVKLLVKRLDEQFAHMEQVRSLLSGLSIDMHSLRITLLESYRLEKAALKDRLRAMEQSLRQLETLPTGNHGNIPAGVGATRPRNVSKHNGVRR